MLFILFLVRYPDMDDVVLQDGEGFLEKMFCTRAICMSFVFLYSFIDFIINLSFFNGLLKGTATTRGEKTLLPIRVLSSF